MEAVTVRRRRARPGWPAACSGVACESTHTRPAKEARAVARPVAPAAAVLSDSGAIASAMMTYSDMLSRPVPRADQPWLAITDQLGRARCARPAGRQVDADPRRVPHHEAA